MGCAGHDVAFTQHRLGYDPIRIDPGSILDRIEQDRTGLSRIDPGSIL
jgi:hypothetical protein